jgi:hypothetical protein
MLQDAINVGCFLITALWMLLLAWWPAWTALAAGLLLAAFGTAAHRRMRGRAALSGAAFVALAFVVVAARWLPWDAGFGALPALLRPFTEVLLVPVPLMAMFVAVAVLQSLLPPPRHAA